MNPTTNHRVLIIHYNFNFMPHYICTGGCGGVTDTPGVCQANGCPKHKHPLAECNCEDGEHKEAFEKAGKEEESEE